MQKQKVVTPPVDLDYVLAKCEERIKAYPMECKEYAKIKQQIEELEGMIEK
jgi:hypothetical protein